MEIKLRKKMEMIKSGKLELLRKERTLATKEREDAKIRNQRRICSGDERCIKTHIQRVQGW